MVIIIANWLTRKPVNVVKYSSAKKPKKIREKGFATLNIT